MKKLFLILFGIGISAPVVAMGPIESEISIEKSSDNVSESTNKSSNNGNGNIFNKIGSGITNGFGKVGSGVKSGFGKVKDVLGLSAEDIAARNQKRAERKAERAAAKADAAAADVSMLESAATAGDEFDNSIDAILESDEVTDPSAELESLEDGYRTKIENITAGKSGKYVNVINQDMETTINSARNLINKNPEKLKEFRDNATSVNRTNMIDKAITGVSTAAMGIGGMQLAQGLSEQKADKEATSEMQNYLSNLYCTYSNKRSAYGEKGIMLDSENKLDLLREEFFNKAADLKYTKEQLGLKAGIESEIVLDEKTTGLYEYQNIGRASSAFGRTSEALMNADSRDAQMIAEQQAASQKRVTGGAIAVAGGAVLSVGGNALLNKYGNKDKALDAAKDVMQTTQENKIQEEQSSETLTTQENLNQSQPEINSEEISGEIMGSRTKEDYLLNNNKKYFKKNVPSYY